MKILNPFTPWEEHYFWVNILLDHAIFVRDYLSPIEVNLVDEAVMFIGRFSEVRNRLEQIPKNSNVNSHSMIEFSKLSAQVSYDYYRFEGKVLNLQLNNQVLINITPTYFNGTLNENGEYLRILQYYMNGADYPPLSLVDLLDLWLEDQIGHASLLNRGLDGIELILKEKVDTLSKLFSAHMLKNDAIKGYLRFLPPHFPVQIAFAREVTGTVLAFNQLVEHVIKLYKGKEVLNATTLRFLEHHFPESCYFLTKLSAFVPDMETPPCSLTSYFKNYHNSL
ncbi:DUF2935 domain-containing protein [Neobacillus niacini]|uniref:DUF2935 domain-containing protein n=1 Tax=Neobacillus niacini TaxID=86668 RepID=UPI001C8F134B|nr:DUF2935 domain-containing protein [Neobacillus niacini]MBY0147961.1 DUF2935 domain-containing protein [Neobacillus niacini]